MWNIVQCSTQGLGHIKTNTPCQDKTFALRFNGVTAVALADGAGSASLSHYGAETVSKHICTDIVNNFDDYYYQDNGAEVKKQLVAGITDALNAKAAELACQTKELASTLLAVAIKNDCFIIMHIGDGVIGYCKNDELKIASEPENGEFTNTTVFTTSKDALFTMKLIKGHLSDIIGFILMSDGSEASLYNKKDKRLSPGLKKVITLNKTLSTDKIQEQLQHSFDTYIRDATMDDCSLVLLMDDGDAFKGYRHLSNFQKCILLGIDSETHPYIIRQYDSILRYAREKRTIRQITKHLRIKQNIAKVRVRRLCNLNYLECNDDTYRTILRL